MSGKKSLAGDRRRQHSAVLIELNRMRRAAEALAERSVADAWEDPAIEFCHYLWDWLDEVCNRAERLEDQGQLPMF